jgi:hypothetical protein
MAGRGGSRSGSGRPRGPRKATIERLITASEQIDHGRQTGDELAKDVLARLMKIAEVATSMHKPTSPAEIAAGQQPAGDWDKFGQ